MSPALSIPASPATTIAKAVWDFLTSGIGVAGSIGQRLQVVEVFDGQVAAGVQVTLTVDGMFSAALNINATDKIEVQVFSDDVGTWLAHANSMRKGFFGCVVGQANKIRFENSDTSGHAMVVVKLG